MAIDKENYKMVNKIAEFDILGLKIPLQPIQKYHDCGFLNDEEFRLKFDSTTYGKSEEYYKKCGGKCTDYGGSVEIFCRDYNNPLKNIIVKGHEETHALKALGKLKKLEKAINEFLNIKIKLSELEEETMADIGGIYAAKKAGYSDEEIMNSF